MEVENGVGSDGNDFGVDGKDMEVQNGMGVEGMVWECRMVWEWTGVVWEWMGVVWEWFRSM